MKIHREDKKNVLFWIAVNSKDPLLQEKHGGFEYFKFSRYTWEWCVKRMMLYSFHMKPQVKVILVNIRLLGNDGLMYLTS